MGHREFRETAKDLMSYNPDDSSDWKNCIRKCQHCGEVWVKVSGCNGETTCGSRHNSKDVSEKPMFRYIFFLDSSGRFTWTKNDLATTRPNAPQLATTRPNIQFYTSLLGFAPPFRSGGQSGDGKGCGRRIIWSDQPRLSKDEIAKCLEVKGVENLIMSMQQQPEFRAAMQSAEQTIDASFSK